MGLQEIINKIEKDCELKIKDLEKEWNQKIEEEKKKIDKELEIYYKDQFEKIEKEIDNELRKKYLDYKLESRNKILESKRAIIDKVFDEVFTKYLSYETDIYLEFLVDLIKKNVKDDGYEIILNKKDKDELSEKLIKKLGSGFKISDSVSNIKGGVILKKGNIEFNLSYDQIFKFKKEKLEKEVGKILNVI
jgi:V/A-type H+-transporting ATPase subunit E